jgi:hypothetical protein
MGRPSCLSRSRAGKPTATASPLAAATTNGDAPVQVILFVGHHKVGSSSLQNYLAQNALALLERGILYPATESEGLTTLLTMALAGDELPDVPLPVNLTEAHNALAFRMLSDVTKKQVPALHQNLPSTEAMLTTLRHQIDIFQPEVVILAAEVFANFSAVSPALIARLREFFDGAEITVTATLRRVDDYMISWHGQRLRFGQAPRALPGGALDHYYRNIHFNYRKMIQGWIKEMPEARLRLRSYDQVMTAGGSVQDFMTQAGLPMPTDPTRMGRANESLHRGLIEIARLGNSELEAGVAHRLFLSLLKLGGKLDLPRASEVEMYGTPARAEMLERFTPIHDWLCEQSGGSFFPDLQDIARPRPCPEYEVNGAALSQIRKQHMDAIPAGARDFLAKLDLTANY